jgi:hypothetical protein
MAADKNKLKQVITTFVIIVIALALTPAVASFVEDGRYSLVTDEYNALVPAVANTTTTEYNIRNVTSTIRITVLDQSDNSTVASTEYTFVVTAVRTITFDGLTSGEEYWVHVTYETVELTPATVLALNTIIPILWIVIVIAVGVVAIKIQLGKGA